MHILLRHVVKLERALRSINAKPQARVAILHILGFEKTGQRYGFALKVDGQLNRGDAKPTGLRTSGLNPQGVAPVVFYQRVGSYRVLVVRGRPPADGQMGFGVYLFNIQV
ncbi:hypothetical protein MUN84_10615 [Hymenobacter sp. 5516J-16]|uniref:hypothetical protein n=1 Tax=Hymenobacter sp. 5516J-16 TaxID=2932253 RepID=UPI001FD458EB|nr:hypothetical protein [Hymenobacter sp. 5516J-16]UOQ78928.1 hypothetical protein MUN84_10615 [Hymenobacter sp. 5516J-16]